MSPGASQGLRLAVREESSVVVPSNVTVPSGSGPAGPCAIAVWAGACALKVENRQTPHISPNPTVRARRSQRCPSALAAGGLAENPAGLHRHHQGDSLSWTDPFHASTSICYEGKRPNKATGISALTFLVWFSASWRKDPSGIFWNQLKGTFVSSREPTGCLPIPRAVLRFLWVS